MTSLARLRRLEGAVLLVALVGMLAAGRWAAGNDEPGPWRSLFDGKGLDGWRIVDRFDFAEHGKVGVRDGAIVLEPGRPATGISYSGQFPRIDYEIHLEAKRRAGNDFFCGLTFPIAKSSCTWIVGGWGGGVIGLSNIDDQSAVENETTEAMEFEQDRWYSLRLAVRAARIEAWIDQKRVIDVATEGRKFSIWWEQEPVLPMGIATWYTGAAIRNVRIRALSPSPADPPGQGRTRNERRAREEFGSRTRQSSVFPM